MKQEASFVENFDDIKWNVKCSCNVLFSAAVSSVDKFVDTTPSIIRGCIRSKLNNAMKQFKKRRVPAGKGEAACQVVKNNRKDPVIQESSEDKNNREESVIQESSEDSTTN